MDNTNILSNFSILYVEDDAAIRNGLTDFLKRRTKQLYTAEDGKVGLDLFIQHSPDIVITDIQMPVMDGLSMGREIKRLDKNTPIIVTTAFNETGFILNAIEIGIEKYVLKPLQRDKLLQALHETAWVLKASKDLMLSAIVFKASSQGIMICDENNTIVTVNEAFSEITGYQTDDVIGLDPKILSSGHQDAKFYHQLWQQLESTSHWQGEIVNRKKNGTYYPEWLNINLVTDEQGKILYYVSLFSDITQRKELENNLNFIAYHDSLTQLPNRSLLLDRITQSIQFAKRQKHKVSVLFLDLDHFKAVNDSLGHAIGDVLLQEVAHRLQLCVRETDTVARIGGDEFVILLSHIEKEDDSVLVAKEVINKLTATFFIQSNEIHIGCSIGISSYPNSGIDAESLLKNADAAMYLVKESGRNNYHFFTQELKSQLIDDLDFEKKLRLALKNNEFEVHYQPMVNASNGEINAIEALVRWNNPELGIVLPNQFIHIMEKIDLINQLGEWVLTTAIGQTQTLQKTIPSLRLAVNVSGEQLKNRQFIDTLKTVLTETHFNPQHLELELTETVFIHFNKETLLNILEQVNALGVHLCIDNCIKGYDLLSRLNNHAIDQIKIDSACIKNLSDKKTDSTVISSIIEMFSKLDLSVIATGVENDKQKAFIQAQQDIQAQGFNYYKPMSFNELQALLKTK